MSSKPMGSSPGKMEAELTWVEEDDGSQAAELCLIHLHIFHFGHQLCQDSAGEQMKNIREF